MRKYYSGLLILFMSLMMISCSEDSEDNPSDPNDPGDGGNTQESLVSFTYSGEFSGTKSTSAVVRVDQEGFVYIDASLDGYTSTGDNLIVQLRDEDFAIGGNDIFVSDRNTLTFETGGYAFQIQAGSTFNVLESSSTVFRAEADELVMSGRPIGDFEAEPKTVTITDLKFYYYD